MQLSSKLWFIPFILLILLSLPTTITATKIIKTSSLRLMEQKYTIGEGYGNFDFDSEWVSVELWIEEEESGSWYIEYLYNVSAFLTLDLPLVLNETYPWNDNYKYESIKIDNCTYKAELTQHVGRTQYSIHTLITNQEFSRENAGRVSLNVSFLIGFTLNWETYDIVKVNGSDITLTTPREIRKPFQIHVVVLP